MEQLSTRQRWERWSPHGSWSRGARRSNPKCHSGSGQGRHAGRKEWVETGRDRVNSGRRFACVPQLIIDLDELDLRELFEVQHQWTCDIVKRPIRLATACKIEISAAIRKCNPAVACKPVADHRKALVAFHIARPFEEFIEHRIDYVL